MRELPAGKPIRLMAPGENRDVSHPRWSPGGRWLMLREEGGQRVELLRRPSILNNEGSQRVGTNRVGRIAAVEKGMDMKKRLLTLLLLIALLTGCVSAPSAPEQPVSPPPTAGAVVGASGASGADDAASLSSAESGAGEGAVSGPADGTAPGETEPVPGGRVPAEYAGTCLADAPQPGEGARRVTVRRAVDGDTLQLTDGTRVRLIGINTPESVDPRRPVEFMGKEAAAYTASLLTGEEIILEPGRQPVDQYGRTLAWVWLPDGRFVNALLVLEGYAQVTTYADNPDHADLLLRCQREAQAAGRGLWGAAAEETAPEPTPESQPEPQPEPAEEPAPAAGLAVLSPPGSVARRSTASVTIQAPPGANCSITVRYKSGPSKAKGLDPRQAGPDGRVTWVWTVGSNTTPGDWPVIIRCGEESVETVVSVR